MGNQQSQSLYGNIMIQTQKKNYIVGDQVEGMVYLNLTNPISSNTLYLIISGKEDVMLQRVKNVQNPYYIPQPSMNNDPHNNNYNNNCNNNLNNLNNNTMDLTNFNQNVHYSVKIENFNYKTHHRSDYDLLSIPIYGNQLDPRNTTSMQVPIYIEERDIKEFYSHSFPIYVSNMAYFPPGQYSFPFTFKLKEDIPGSFKNVWKENGRENHGFVSYTLIAGLKNDQLNQHLYTNYEFCVDQKFEESSGHQIKNIEKVIKSCCCCSKGKMSMHCSFEKDKYMVGEQAKMLVGVDNSQCSAKVKSITCRLVQHTFIKTRQNHTKSCSLTLKEFRLPGINGGEKLIENDSLKAILPVETKDVLQASCDGDLIKNSFEIQVLTDIDACICCDEHPYDSIKIKIFNKQFKYEPAQPQYPNWNPQQMNPYVCTISNDYKMTDGFKNEIQINGDITYPTSF